MENFTHYALKNGSGELIAVIKRGVSYRGRVIQAIEDELGESVDGFSFKSTGFNEWEVIIKIPAYEHLFYLSMTWEY